MCVARSCARSTPPDIGEVTESRRGDAIAAHDRTPVGERAPAGDPAGSGPVSRCYAPGMYPAASGVEWRRHTFQPSCRRRKTSVMTKVPLRSSPSTVADI